VLILGLETATDRLGLALARGEHLLAELHLDVGRRHTEQLALALDTLCSDVGVPVKALTAIAVSIGPGSFTGLRIGLAFAKGLGLALAIPVIGVPTLEVLARGAEPWIGPVVACLDARRGEVYFSAYELAPGRMTALDASAAVGSADRVAERVRALGRRVLLIGAGTDLVRDHVGPEVIIAPRRLGWPRAGLVAALGGERVESGTVEEPDHVEPIYVRRSDAELRSLAGRT
jgi:tRNA threonylcarbamoyladenosine biosynthesis protein TsaB